MPQSDQSVQNATFPSVRADINDNLAALFSQSSGNSAPSVTVAFQPWVDTSSNPPVWKIRNGSNNEWITVGVLDPAGFNAGGVTAIANGGTGAITAALALAALLPSQAGNAGKGLVTDGTTASWGSVAAGASIQVFTASGTYTPTAGKTTFLAFVTGGGGGGGGGGTQSGSVGGGGGGGGSGFRLYTSAEMGSSAAITFGAGGAGGANNAGSGFGFTGSTGGTSEIDPSGTGLTLSAYGGAGGGAGAGGAGGSNANSYVNVQGAAGIRITSTAQLSGGESLWAAGAGRGGNGSTTTTLGTSGSAGTAGTVFILEW
jgi:hypothetical protein